MPQSGDRKRVLIALDSGSLSRMAIAAAARLATGLQAELQALFIEDVNLRRLAGLPFARELGVTSAQPRRFDVAELDRGIGLQARQVRRVLEAAARELPLTWSLEVVRGDLVAVALSRTQAADLLVLGRTRRPSYRGVHGARALRRPERRVGQHAIVALFDGTAAAERVLEAALVLERRAHAGVLVAVPASRPDQGAALRDQADAMLKARGHVPGGYVMLADAGIKTIAETAKRHHAGAVLLPVAELARAEHEFESLVDDVDCPVVLIR